MVEIDYGSEVTPKELSIHVENVDIETFKQIGEGLTNPVLVEPGIWESTDGKTDILNFSAFPCLIVYVLNTETGEIISGHFPITRKEISKQLIVRDIGIGRKNLEKQHPEGIVIPDGEETEYYRQEPEADFREYQDMLTRIKKWSNEIQKGKIEAYLFGQNFPPYPQDKVDYDQGIVNAMILHNEVISELNNAGIQTADILDTRIPGANRGEDTIFLSKTHTIYHCVYSLDEIKQSFHYQRKP